MRTPRKLLVLTTGLALFLPALALAQETERARRTCESSVLNLGYDVEDSSRVQQGSGPGQYQMKMQVRKDNRVLNTTCYYDARTNQVRIPKVTSPLDETDSGGRNDLETARDRVQGMCEAEAENWGYEVNSSSNFRQTVGGYQMAMRVRKGTRVLNTTCYYDARANRVRIPKVTGTVDGGTDAGRGFDAPANSANLLGEAKTECANYAETQGYENIEVLSTRAIDRFRAEVTLQAAQPAGRLGPLDIRVPRSMKCIYDGNSRKASIR